MAFRLRPRADGSPVTEADGAAEEAVLNALAEAHPGDGFLGEELGERLGTTGRRWTVDGIDGTRFFAAGLTEWLLDRVAERWRGRPRSDLQPGPRPQVVGHPRAGRFHRTVEEPFHRHPESRVDGAGQETGPFHHAARL